MSDKARKMIEALGGKTNIKSLDSCITRLRVIVNNPGLVDDKKLRALGAVGVIKKEGSVQVVLGTVADLIESEMKKILSEMKE
nr:PTS glucose/sucrose transporter subunit IIB [Thermanaeromonas toyohensis]